MDFQYLKRTVESIFVNITKGNFFIKALIGAAMYFQGIHVYIYAIFVLTLIDVCTGIYASIKRGESFKTKILRKGLLDKFLLYILLLLTGFFFEMVTKSIITYTSYYIVFLISFLISTYEVVSIFENLLVINPNLLFLNKLIKLTKSFEDKAVDEAGKAIDSVKPNKEENSSKINK